MHLPRSHSRYEPKPRLRRLIQGVSVLCGTFLLVGLAAGCGGGDQAAGQGKGRPPSLVRVAQAEKKPVARRIVVVGNVTPVRTSVVASGANGVVQYLRERLPEERDEPTPAAPENKFTSPGEEENRPAEIEVGQFAAEGTVLSVLRMEATNAELEEARSVLAEKREKLQAVETNHPKELAHAEAMKKIAEAVKTNAEQKYQRTKSLYDRGVANESELEDAFEKWEMAEQSLIAADQQLEQIRNGRDIEQAQAALNAQQAHVAYLESEKAKRTTKAPFHGHVVEVHTYVGQWLSKGDPVVTLARLDEVDVIVNVDQADLAHVRLGQPARVTVEGGRQTEWLGRIVYIVPRSDWTKGSRGFPVVVRIKNELDSKYLGEGETSSEEDAPLKAGMLARVTIEGPKVETLLVPKDALVRTTEGSVLYIYEPKDPAAKLDPNQPTPGGVRRVAIQPDLAMSEGNMIGIRLLDRVPESENPLKPGIWVVTEGGERFAAPVDDNTNAKSRIEDQTKTK